MDTARAEDMADETPEPFIDEGGAGRPRWVESGEKALAILVAVALAGSALAIGSVHTVALVPVAAVAAAAAIVAVPLREIGAKDRAWPAPALILLALSLFTALQAVPLPLGFLAKIAPANADVWSRSLMPFGERPGWGSVSLDPGATLVEALKWLTYASTFFAAAVLGARRGAEDQHPLEARRSTVVAVMTVEEGLVDVRQVIRV